MKFAYRIKLSTYRSIIKRGLTIKRMREKDFRGADFSGLDFSNTNFFRANFEYAKFADADFCRADFRDANFSRAEFRYVTFENAEFKHAKFSRANFEETNFFRANFVCVKLDDTIWSDANFKKATLCLVKAQMIRFPRALFKRVDFSHVDARSINLSNGNGERADFAEASFYHSIWGDAQMQYINLSRLCLRGATFTHANLQILGFGYRFKIGWRTAVLVGGLFTLGGIQYPVKYWMKNCESICQLEMGDYTKLMPKRIRASIRAVFALNKARRRGYLRGVSK